MVIKKIPSILKKLHTGLIETPIVEGVFLENPKEITIEKGVLIEPGSYIKGPCFIGKGCEIKHGAFVRENTILVENVTIGHCSEVKNSIFFPGAKAPHFNYVGDSILGIGTNLGAGVKCANVRFDKKEIEIHLANEIVQTGMNKLGVILGDGSQIGCNAVTAPGTLIGKNRMGFPCEYIHGFIPSKEKS